jgi:CRP/FNR family cyclic AMP-dependent transcriptional regulator
MRGLKAVTWRQPPDCPGNETDYNGKRSQFSGEDSANREVTMTMIHLFQNDPNRDTYSAGQTIFYEGEPGNVMFGVIEGEVEITLRGRQLDTIGPGGIFGELALVDDAPRSATAVAKTACQVVRINEDRFTFLIEQTPFFAVQVMRIMADRLRRANAIITKQ